MLHTHAFICVYTQNEFYWSISRYKLGFVVVLCIKCENSSTSETVTKRQERRGLRGLGQTRQSLRYG